MYCALCLSLTLFLNHCLYITRHHCFLEISSRYIHSLIKYVDIVNAELIESTLKQTIMCSSFNDFVWLSKYKKCCMHLIFIDCFI